MTVVNAGDISGWPYVGEFEGLFFHGNGIALTAGGSVTNQVGGNISGGDGIYATAAMTVVNAGDIHGQIAGVDFLRVARSPTKAVDISTETPGSSASPSR
jgi:hypothetical protein